MEDLKGTYILNSLDRREGVKYYTSHAGCPGGR